MYGLFLRKNLLLIAVWGGVFSLFPQNQALSCWWNCCCCCHQEDKSSTVGVKSRETDPLINGTSQDHGGTSSTVVSKQQSPSSTGEERRDPPTPQDSRRATLLIEETERQDPIPPSSLKISTSSDSSDPLDPEWGREEFSFPTTDSCQKVWKIFTTIFGDENPSVSLSSSVRTNFSKIKSSQCDVFTTENESNLNKLLYKKVVHFAPEEMKDYVNVFVTKVKDLWTNNPPAFSFSYFFTETSYYFFAIQKGRVMYIKMPRIKGKNDQETLSRSTTRVPSRVISRDSSRHTSRLPSPKRTDKKSKEEEKKKKTSSESDSDE